jgi:hypothetical protein
LPYPKRAELVTAQDDNAALRQGLTSAAARANVLAIRFEYATDSNDARDGAAPHRMRAAKGRVALAVFNKPVMADAPRGGENGQPSGSSKVAHAFLA